jgi:hypothetical protein
MNPIHSIYADFACAVTFRRREQAHPSYRANVAQLRPCALEVLSPADFSVQTSGLRPVSVKGSAG